MSRTILALALAGSLARASAPPRRSPPATRRAAAAEVVVLRPVRQIRPRPAAARLQGLSRGLRRLPRPQPAVVPQPRPTARLLRRRRSKAIAAEYKVQDGPNDAGRDVRARRPPGRPLPAAVAERERRARALQRRAAGLLGARQGAHLRARLPLVHLRRVHPVPGAGRRLHPRAAGRLRGQAAAGLHAAAGHVLQQVLPRPRHRDAAAAAATSASTTPTARRPRSSSTPRTSPPS